MLLPPCFSCVFAVAHPLFPLGCRKLGSCALEGNETSVSWISGVTCEAEGLFFPDVSPTLFVAMATPAEVKEGKWLGINWLVKEKKGLYFLLSTSE